MKSLAVLAVVALALLAAPALAERGPSLHARAGDAQPLDLGLAEPRVPHHLGAVSRHFSERSADLPTPALLFTGEALVVQEKESAGTLVVPNVLNAGETRADDTYLYPYEFGQASADLDDDLRAAEALFASGAKQARLPTGVAVDPPRDMPDLEVGLDLARGALDACAVDCALEEGPRALAAQVLGAARFHRAHPLAGAPALGHREAFLLPEAELAPLPQAEPAPQPGATPGLATQAAGAAGASPLPLDGRALLAASTLVLGALMLGPLALYSKIRRDATLDNDTRRSVFEAVVATPGLSIQEVARRASISHSTAAYHLDRLSGAGLVVATGDGNKVRYYRNGGRFTEQERRLLPCLETPETVRVLETVVQRPWTYRAEVASLLAVTATTVNWHLKRLFAAGVLTEVREGRSAYLFVDRAALAQACAGLHEKAPDSPARAAAARLLALLGAPPAPAMAPLPAAPAAPAAAAPAARAAPLPTAPMPVAPSASLAPPDLGAFGRLA